MTFQLTPYAVAEFVAALISAAVAVLTWKRRSIPGGSLFTLMMCSVVTWSLMAALESGSVGLEKKLLFSQLSYIGTVSTAPFFFLFVLRYRDGAYRIRAGLVIAVFVIPLATLALALTNPTHHLVWTSIVLDPRAGENVAIYTHGLWYWIALAYYFGLAFAAAIVLGRSVLRSQGLYVSQTVVLFAGLLVPWVGALIYLLPFNPFPGLDLVSIGFAFTGVLLLLGITRYRLFDLVPMARDVLVEKLADGLLVVDAAGRIIDANPAALALLGLEKSVVGTPLSQALAALSEPLARIIGRPDERTEASLPGEPTRHVELRASALSDRRGRPAGCLLLVHDVTVRRGIELEREKLIGELRAAIADIKTLRGLLPICASCKKIRDDGGYWQGLEQYLSDHSEAQFSHGLCPECIARLYPELAESLPGDTG